MLRCALVASALASASGFAPAALQTMKAAALVENKGGVTIEKVFTTNEKIPKKNRSPLARSSTPAATPPSRRDIYFFSKKNESSAGIYMEIPLG